MNAKPQRRSLLLRLLAVAIAIIVAVLAWRHFSAAQPTAGTTPGAHQAAGKTGAGRAAGGRRGAPMSPVQAATATQQTVPRFLSGLGTATAANTVTVTSRVDGQLMAIHFTEGQQVKAGDLLAEIDPRPFQVQLTQAQGQLAKDQATLANARRDLARYQQLVKTNLVSRQELDTQASLVQQTEGAIKADQGAVDSAKLQITYSRITAPIDGRVGLKLVDVGNYVTSGSTTGLVVITQTHPIDVVFTLPEGNIADLLKAQKAGPVSVEAWDRTNQNKLTTGSLLSLDNQIDTATGTIKLKARFANEDDALFPNQFVNARLQVDTLHDAVVIPTAALQMGNEGNFVWTLSEDNKVSKHRVTAGVQDSRQVVISAGLNAGDRVVTDGIDRLTEGMQVEVLAPNDAPATSKAKREPDVQRKS
ncbi:MdtA/MuxA family multidrug efflux RND transporter periplasmic adaptor subunit [Serratia marcescens]|uniref:MdtA/MuxA family multidrug efflux RND transporter periplasmic adaptor subunit n=1 Tax=Serratia marcescens TaxID=615 RepID=UPI00143E2BD2|nr:MdtA/MuxA family multidrug efflux RND transporter periplasmic adaptor subunit [Serratia marcescens]MBH2603864.1 MdtA/MuxA family multidrug efflux RND transporter periplasmic adaptor subunit [Serratia marcescens]MBH2891975.1 MdtA/MuxA family multidrug efflux RND transporter periplasmic adaptor subunit [Serratia marcescens]MBN5392957.1 MdtA/MuxA family multidrug efflux RND transporter periplasmic adaptor subunit [Serratia marcescens]QIX77800.1 MdtA/MuxA family multidrug efflux RND transporter 